MRRIAILISIFLIISLFAFTGCNKTTNDENETKLDITASPTITYSKEPMILVKSNGETTAPFVNWIWSSTWTDKGWLATDGMSIIYTLHDIANEMPIIRYSDDFSTQYKEKVSFSSISIYRDNFQRLHHNVDLSYLDNLPKGTYYISINVIEQGKYIEDEKQHELKGYECAYKLVV